MIQANPENKPASQAANERMEAQVVGEKSAAPTETAPAEAVENNPAAVPASVLVDDSVMSQVLTASQGTIGIDEQMVQDEIQNTEGSSQVGIAVLDRSEMPKDNAWVWWIAAGVAIIAVIVVTIALVTKKNKKGGGKAGVGGGEAGE